jgi:DNA-binding MarR family transcriptional regulator
MDEPEIPGDVQALLRDRIDSYEELEILLLLAGEPAVTFTAEATGERLNIAVPRAANALHRLRAGGLAESSRGEAGTLYRYSPRNLRLASSVELLVREYRDNRLGIVKVLTANAITRMRTATLRAFADAFVLNREKEGEDG